MDVKQTNDSVFEALFRQAVIDNFFDELDSLPPEDDLAKLYKFSSEHQTRMKRLFAREKRRERLRIAAKWSGSAAAVIVISAATLFGALMFVPGGQALVFETITEAYEEFTHFALGNPETVKTNQEPAYIPKGFCEELRESAEITDIVLYINEDGQTIVFQSGRARGPLPAGSEERKYEIITINGDEYHVFTAIDAAGENIVIWESAGQRYAVISTIPADELLKIALSVE